MMQSGDSSPPPKYLMTWPNDVVLEFLELYRAERLLWDPKHPLHRNRPEVADAWKRIQTGLSLHTSVSDLKRKKESLMTSFRMHLHKKKSQESYTTNWFAFTAMERFLGEKYDYDCLYSDSELLGSGSDRRQRHSSCQGSIKIRAADPSVEIPEFLVVKKQEVDDARATSVKRSTTDSYSSYKNNFNACNSSMIENDTLKKDQDEYDLYGQLLAKKMRKLDERQRDLAMHEIDNIMFRAKMKSESQTSRDSSSIVNRKVNSPVFISLGHDEHTYGQTNMQYEEIHHSS